VASAKKRIKAVTFDLWQTLLLERDGASERRSSARCNSVARTLNRFGLTVSAEQVNVAMKDTVDSLVKVWDSNRDVSHLGQLRLIVKHISNGSVALEDEWVDELSAAYVSAFLEVQPYLNPGAEEVLQHLRREGKQVGHICNTGLTPGFSLRGFLEQSGVAEYFDVMVFSDEEDVRKPDPRIFRITARRLKMEPREIVHVGDNLKADVWGARNAGFKAIYFAGEEGRDRLAEADPTSLVALSRGLGTLEKEDIIPDKTIGHFNKLIRAIKELRI
jgi:HAD superfamily hydrolase (TIGR01509 family)